MLTLVFLSLLSVTFTSPYTVAAPSTTNTYRLPNTTLPSKYRIDLEVPEDSLNGRNTNFRGFVEIDFIVTKPANQIFINSVVNVSNISVRDAEQNVVPIFKFVENPRTEILLILLKTELVISTKYVLKIYYIGNLTTRSIKGPSRIEYTEDGSKEYLIVTQFEAGYARYAFPCFDEPSYKAKFILSITYPKEYRAMSNRPEAKTTTKNNYKTTEFQESPKMSTYLLAFAISKLTCTKSANSDENFSLSVCSREKFATNRTLALDYAPKIINAMSAWTNYNYSQGNNKMDQFSLPGLTELAMENWGFVTYQEYMLLWDQKETSNEFKQMIIELIAHECSHQWFGNLVTTSWWNTLFLNEGFATYFQYHLLNLIGLESYEMEKQFIIIQQQTVLLDDGFSDSSSLTSAAETDDEIEEKFGTISYNKGASIIKMVENLLGPKNFQESLRHYLKKYAFRVTTPQNLWDSLSTSIKKGTLPENVTFTNFIDNWTNKAGFPVVRVALKGNDVILSQKRFLYEGETKDQWYIPITYITSNSDSYQNVWLKPSESLTLKNIVTNNGWIVVNHNSRGYFRVRYTSILYHRLSKALKTNAQQFADLDRAQIVDDTFNLALAGQISYLEVFQIIAFLKNETSYYPWNAAFRGFNEITSRFKDDSEIVKHINSVILNLVETVATNISVTNWERIDHVSSLKLPLVWMAACKAGQKKCVLETKRLFKEFKENGVSLNPNIRQVVYCNALKYGDDIYGDWHFLWNKSLFIDQPHEKIYILTSLACTKSEQILAYYLKTSLSSPLDFQVIWDSVYLSSSLGLEVAFNYFLENHSDILTFSYDDGTAVLANILERLFTQDQINRLQNFIDGLDEDSDIKSFAQAFVADAKTNLRLQARIKSDLERNFGIRPSVVTQSYAFRVTTPQNLWDSLSTSIKKGTLPENVTFTNFIDNWTNKAGFPVVRVALKGNDVILSQKRFLYEGETKDQWYIPITYITSNSDSYQNVWLKPSESLTLKNIVTNNGWIVVNHNSRGYFRVRYTSILYHRLSKALKTNAQQFADLDRAQIVDDTFNLALAGQISYLEVFQIIAFLKNETSYYPWNAAFRGFNEITSRFKDDSEIVKHINSVILNLVETVATNISVTNWERIDHVSSLKLPLVWMAACKAGQKKCVLETKRLFKEFKENGVSLNPNIRQVVYCNALKYGDDIYGDWHFLWNKSLFIDQPHEKIYILTSLACTKSEQILAYYLKTSLSSPLDFQVIWDSVYLSSSLGLEVAFNYFLENHSDILTFSYDDGTAVLANILERLFTQDQINRLQNFIDGLDEDSDIKSFAQAFVADAKTNLRLQARIKSDLERNFGIRPSVVTQS